MLRLRKKYPTVWLSVIFSAFLGLTTTQDTQAKTDLVFIVDGSGSISSTDWALQRNGIVAALQDPLIVPRDGSVAVAVIQFASGTRVEFPYRLIDSEADAQAAINEVQTMIQFQGATGPGNGINTATSHLMANGVVPDDFQSYCMSTDGTRNTGATVGTAIGNAKAAAFGLDRYSVIAIEDPPWFDAADANSHYGPHIFGGGAVFVVNNFAEFASFVGSLCLGEPLKLVGLEVTQAVQDLENTVKLVEKKKTLVRVYIEPETGPGPIKATARLKGTRGGVALGTLTAINSGGSITAKANALDRRNILNDSLNFLLPSSWRAGNLTLELEAVGGTLDCKEKAGPTANDCKATVNFNPGSEVEVKFFPVKWKSDVTVHTPSGADLNNLESRTLALLPTSKVDRTTGSTIDMGNGFPALATVNSRLETQRFLDFCWSFLGCDRRYYGALRNPGSLSGLANGIPGTASSSIIKDGDVIGRNVHIHEILHTLERHHAVKANKFGVCGSVAGAGAPVFPHFENVSGNQRAVLGPLTLGDDKIMFGWDSLQNTVRDPRVHYEVMSYCGSTNNKSQWISSYTWEGTRNTINTEFSSASFSVAQATQATIMKYLLVRGIIDLDINTVDFQSVVSLESDIAPPSLPPGDFTLIVKDKNDNVLETISFSPIRLNPFTDDPSKPKENKAFFIIPVLDNPTIAEITVKNGSGSEIGSFSTGVNPPTVTVTFPNGGEILNPPTATFTWTGNDPDGDSLTYVVQFSKDGGSTWETLVTDFAGTQYEATLAELGETSQGKIRIQVSDGLRTSQDESDGMFVTPNSAPICNITSPSNGQLFVGIQQATFEASSFDKEGGLLAINWQSNLNGSLGNGDSLARSVHTLAEGLHTITMTCTDNGGLSDSDTVNIRVSRVTPVIKGDADTNGQIDRVDLSLILRDRNKPTNTSICGSKCDMNDDGVINMLDMRLAALKCTNPGCAQ